MDIKIISASEALEATFINKINKKYHHFVQDIMLKINEAINNRKSSCCVLYPTNMRADEKCFVYNFLICKGYKVKCDVLSERNYPPHSLYTDFEKSSTIFISWYR